MRHPTLTTDGDDPLYLASADLNGDGLPDVVSASVEDGALGVFFNNSLTPGTLNTPLVLPAPGASQLAIGDMNGDGLPDLVAADFNVSMFLQSSPGTFSNAISLYPGGANWVAVGDLNGDGNADVTVTDAAGVQVLLHLGAAAATTFAAPVTVFTQTSNLNVSGWNLVAIADLDHDGLNDLVITDPGPTGGATPTVNVLLQDPANHGQFLAAVSYPIAPASLAQSIVVAGSGRRPEPSRYRHRRHRCRERAVARSGPCRSVSGRQQFYAPRTPTRSRSPTSMVTATRISSSPPARLGRWSTA